MRLVIPFRYRLDAPSKELMPELNKAMAGVRV